MKRLNTVCFCMPFVSSVTPHSPFTAVLSSASVLQEGICKSVAICDILKNLLYFHTDTVEEVVDRFAKSVEEKHDSNQCLNQLLSYKIFV